MMLELTDCDDPQEIRVLSLRGRQLRTCLQTVGECQNLSILYMQQNQVQDLRFLASFQQLRKIDLSDNMIESLPPAQVFAQMRSLQFLFLHNNALQKWQDLQALTHLPQIIHITLFNNPVCQIPGYRSFIVNQI